MDKLKEKKLVELRELAKEMGIESVSKYRKDELIKLIEEEENKRSEESKEEAENDLGNKFDCDGILEILPDGYGFLRTQLYESGDDDIYVPPKLDRKSVV